LAAQIWADDQSSQHSGLPTAAEPIVVLPKNYERKKMEEIPFNLTTLGG